jgi:hypothetical protein
VDVRINMRLKIIITTLYKGFFCKHKVTEKSACPFTERTYTTCSECGKTLSAVKTVN